MTKETKDEMSKKINQLLFEKDDKIDFSKMNKVDLAVFKEKLDSDEAISIGVKLLQSRGVGKGKAMDLVKQVLDGNDLQSVVKNFVTSSST